jgi:hypothetical protein
MLRPPWSIILPSMAPSHSGTESEAIPRIIIGKRESRQSETFGAGGTRSQRAATFTQGVFRSIRLRSPASTRPGPIS